MDFRQYDNALGRFLCIDALSEKNHYLSPYNFADGNPIFFSDPSGLDALKYEHHQSDAPYGSGGIEHAIGSGGFFDVFSVGGGGAGGSGGDNNDPTVVNNGFELINYSAGANINFMAIIPYNYKHDKVLYADYIAACLAGVPIMLVDGVDGFSQGLDYLKKQKSTVENFVIHSHGSSGEFSIGTSLISSSSIGGDGHHSVLKELGSKLKDKTVIILACSSGKGQIGDEFTQEVSKQLQSTVITSQHLLMGGYAYGGTELPLMSFNSRDKDDGKMFRISNNGSKPINIYNLSLNIDKSTPGYYYSPPKMTPNPSQAEAMNRIYGKRN
jgi:hypothetical protein